MITVRPSRQLHPVRQSLLAVLAAILCGCAGSQIQATTQVSDHTLRHLELKAQGVAFITSSTVTGQEEDKQAMTMTFVDAMKRGRPDLRVITQPETLSAINRTGLTDEYKRMLEDYRVTGILNRKTLEQIAHATNVRYIAQLKLSGFRQESKNRFSALGLRIVETQITGLRMFLQVWDSKDGSIAWEGAHELTAAHDSTRESPVTLKNSIEEAAQHLIAKLP